MKGLLTTEKMMTKKQYNGSITDDELRKLPVLQFRGRVTLVDNMEKYRRAMADLLSKLTNLQRLW